jgi:hypothetical protein
MIRNAMTPMDFANIATFPAPAGRILPWFAAATAILPAIGSTLQVTPPGGPRQRASVDGWLHALQAQQAGGPPA